jgi:hypothetical protein
METIKTYSFTTEDDVTKQITLAGPNIMGVMYAYCGAGPMKLMNLYSNHFPKNKCPKLMFVDTQGKYMKKTKEQMDKGKGKIKAKGKRKEKTKTIGKTDKAETQVMRANLDNTDLAGVRDKETNEDADLDIHSGEKERKTTDKLATAPPRRSKRRLATTK